jgi:transposase
MGCTSKNLRLRIIIAYNEHKTYKGAARAAGVAVKVVKRWVDRYKSTGGLERRAGNGRRPAMDAAAVEKALELLQSGTCGGSDAVARELHSRGITAKQLHRTTIVKAVKKLAKARGTPIKAVRGKPHKQLTAINKQQRREFALKNKSRNWKNVMFTDRKRFQFSHPGTSVNPVSWVRKGSSRQAITVNHPASLNIYAGITVHGVTRCHIVAGTSKRGTHYTTRKGTKARNVTAAEYKTVLQSTIMPDGDRIFGDQGVTHWVLQQDNDPCHKAATSAVAQHNQETTGHTELLKDWPPNSPDLNPIENMWAFVEAKVQKVGCKTFDDFCKAVLNEMASVPKDILAHYYSSMPKRIAQVIEKGGDKTGY